MKRTIVWQITSTVFVSIFNNVYTMFMKVIIESKKKPLHKKTNVKKDKNSNSEYMIVQMTNYKSIDTLIFFFTFCFIF